VLVVLVVEETDGRISGASTVKSYTLVPVSTRFDPAPSKIPTRPSMSMYVFRLYGSIVVEDAEGRTIVIESDG